MRPQPIPGGGATASNPMSKSQKRIIALSAGRRQDSRFFAPEPHKHNTGSVLTPRRPSS